MPMFHFLRSTLPAVVAAMASTHGSFELRGPVRAGPVAGTQVVFEPQAELTGQSFYDLPYPFDVRLNAHGGPDLSGMPTNGADAALDLIPAAGDRAGFPTVPVGYFRLTGAPAPHALDEVMPAEKSAAVLLLDVDPLSPERGTLYPTIATVIPAGAYAPKNLLAVAAAPGLVLPAGRKYAFVLRRSYGDQAGQPLGVSSKLAHVLNGGVPPGPRGWALRQAFRDLTKTLGKVGVHVSDVAGAAVFTTGDVVADNARLSSSIVEAEDVHVENLAIAPGDGASHPRVCELTATVTMPQYQQGVQPFNTEGNFERAADGTLVVQGAMTVPVVLSLPKQPMPLLGYPLIMYLHGTAGLAGQVVDRGAITEPGGAPTPGEGPAHVLAERGFASVGAAMPLNPERLPGAVGFEYVNFGNLAALPYTYRQGVFEQRLLLEALSRLTIDPSVLEGCDGVSLPAGASQFHLDLRSLGLMGQSMGAQYANLLAAVEPAVQTLVPTGSGGPWNKFLVESKFNFGGGATAVDIMASLFGVPRADLSPLHPTINLLETAWEPGEPLVSAARVGQRPLPGHPVRQIYQPVGLDDEFFPPTLFDAMALGSGVEQAGDVFWSSMQTSLALAGYDGLVDYPVARNTTSEKGVPRTGVVVQYLGDGIANPHTIFSQLDEVKYQYGCFFATHARTGRAVVPAPAPLGTPCPE
jgi:hypothetical protein